MAKFGRFVTGLVLVGATVGAGLGAVVLDAASAGAASPITVNTTVDSSTVTAANCTPGAEVPGACNLRDALAEASGGDTLINLPDPNTIGGSGHIYPVLSSAGELFVNDVGHTVTITGTTGAATTILKAQCTGLGCSVTTRVLHVATGTTADISGITAEGGVITGTGPGGGGILNDGTLNLSSSNVTGNTANSGGGVYLEAGAATLTGDTITANRAGSGGGITMEDGTNVISGSSVDDNNTTSSEGGGVDIEDRSPGDSASLSNVDVSHNAAAEDGGGLYVGNQSATSNNPVTLTNVTADNNTASGGGGGLYVSNDGAGGGTVTMTGGSANNNSCG